MGPLWFVGIVCAVILAVWVLLVPDAISHMMRKSELLSEIEDIWKKSWLGNLLLAVGGLCVVVGWWFPIPSGYAITGIAVIAGIMALRPEMGGWERSLWFVVLVLFAAMEIRAINRDRKDQTDKFEKTSQGLQTAINNSKTAVQDLTLAISEGREHFDKTMSGVNDAVETQTGGNSFCYIDFDSALHDVGGMTVVRVGKYPLHALSARIMDAVKVQMAISNLIRANPNEHGGSLAQQIFDTQRGNDVIQPIPEFATPSKFLGGYQMTHSDLGQSFQVLFSAANGSWIERLEIREIKGKWTKAMMVEVPGRKPYRFIKIDPDYPRVDGKLDVPGWPRPEKGKPEWEQ